MASHTDFKMIYNVYSGEYPFTDWLGIINADTPEEALDKALKELKQFPHCVVEPELTPLQQAHLVNSRMEQLQ